MNIRNAVTQMAERDPKYAQAIDAMEAQVSRMPVVPEDLDDAIKFLEFVLQNPDRYQEARSQAIKEGLFDEEDILPKYDQVFVVSLLIALYGMQDRLKKRGYARGGLAIAGRRIAAQGRGGDTHLAHINRREAGVLRAMGGSGTINPNTGLKEYGGFKKFFKAVLPIALSFFLPGIGTAIGTALGASGIGASILGGALFGGVTSALTGGDFLKGALTGGLGGALGSVFGGEGGIFGSSGAISEAGAAAPVEGATAAGSGITQGATLAPGLDLPTTGTITPSDAAVGNLQKIAISGMQGAQLPEIDTSGITAPQYDVAPDQYAVNTVEAPVQAAPRGVTVDPSEIPNVPDMNQSFNPDVDNMAFDKRPGAPGVTDQGVVGKYQVNPKTGAMEVASPPGKWVYNENLGRPVFTPNTPSLLGQLLGKPDSGDKGIFGTGITAGQALMGLTALSSLSSAPPQAQAAVKQLSPAQQEYMNRPSITWDWGKMQADAAANNMSLNQFMARNWPAVTSGAYNVAKAARGGALSNVARFARGAGSGRADVIDAKLSDGEYVIDAETVAMLGDGSNEAGARMLDAMRQNIRMHKGKVLAKGKFSPDAKSPLTYLRGM